MKEAAQAEDERYIRVTLDAQTGEILRYYKRVNREEAEEREEKKRIGKDKAREKAVQFVKQLAPGYAHRVFLQETLQPEYRWEEVPREFSFTFRQLANGVPVQNRGISVSIDAYTGELTNFHIDWDRQTTYPEVPPHTLSPEEAKALLFKNLDVELQYVFPREKFWLAERRDEAGGERTLKLVYQLKSKAFEAQELFLDAVTGQWRRFDDGEIVRGDELPEDVKGHWAEKELQLMFQYNAFEVENNQINPDEPVKRGELIKMLMLALHEGDFYYAYDNGTKAYYNDVSQESAYFGYVQAAAESHILDTTKEELNPEEVVDREEMAVLITRALGYGGVAEYEHIFHLPFADADQIEAKGHVAIVSGLKIMRGSEDNRFMPHKEATRAQAAAAFYRFLQKRVELHP